MDNIIQIIVFFFIVYSILAPILSKKKPPQKVNKKPAKRNYGYNEDVRNKTRTSSQPSSTDILEDILGFKIPKTGGEYGKPFPSRRKTDYDDLKTVDYDTDVKTNYKDLETDTTIPDVDYDKLPSVETAKAMISSSEALTETSSAKNQKAKFVRDKFINKVEIRDIILIKEIFDKPKALRR
jgi:hypothetical protein